MSERPLVSIVLPILNGSRFLAQALDALIAQTYANWELVFVDGGSTDGTQAIIDRYCAADPRIRQVTDAKGLNLPASLNRGFREVKGEYLGWMSDDNVYRPHALATLVRYLDEHPDCGVVYGAHTWIDGEGNDLEKVVPKTPENLVFHDCIGLAFLYRRRVMELVGDYSVDHYLAEDYDFWFRAFMRSSMHPIPDDLLMIRRHKESLTDRFPERISVVTHKVIERHLAELRRTKPDLGHETTLRVANESMRYGNPKKMRRLFFAALRQRPLRTWFNLPSARLPIAVFLGEPFAKMLTNVLRVFRPRREVAAGA